MRVLAKLAGMTVDSMQRCPGIASEPSKTTQKSAGTDTRNNGNVIFLAAMLPATATWKMLVVAEKHSRRPKAPALT